METKHLRMYEMLTDKYKFVEKVEFGDTCTDLLEKLKGFSKKGFFFRGQRDALWPIVSSGQRAYMKLLNRGMNCSYIDFLVKSLEYVKSEKEFLPRFTDFSLRRTYYEHELYGWLQHYSYPTPYIDFTSNPMVALYMATANIHEPYDAGHFSIYVMDGKYESDRNEPERLEEVIDKYKAEFEACNKSEEDMYAFDTWKEFDFALVHKDGSLKPWSKSLARDRIASQGGLFVYLKSAKISQEQFFARQSKMQNGGEGEGCILSKIKCLDVPYSMVPLIKEVCNRKGVTRESLGLADQSIDNCMKCLAGRFADSIQPE